MTPRRTATTPASGIQVSSTSVSAGRLADRCPGQLEVDRDDDTWADHDENCHGPIEPRGWLLQQFPDGFYWACCEKRGSNPGCQRDFHRARDGGQGTSA